MQTFPPRFSRGPLQTLSPESRAGAGLRALLPGSGWSAASGRVAHRLGTARNPWPPIEMVRPSSKKMRTTPGLHYEMNLLLASLRRVEIRIEPQTITQFLKWKNRMAEYNRGQLPEGISGQEEEPNFFLEPEPAFEPQ